MPCASRHGGTRAAEVLPLIPPIVLTRFTDRPLSEICKMVGITLEDFTQSQAYQEIFGLGEACGEAREGAKVTLLLLARGEVGCHRHRWRLQLD
jgi:hypothetical protein